MQIKKETVRADILSAAREVFMKLGYEKAPLREIANRAGLTKGAIYAYFNSKDALFCALVDPAVQYITGTLKHSESSERALEGRSEKEALCEEAVRGFQKYADDIWTHQSAFQLLLFKAAGSSLEGFRDTIIDLYVKDFNHILKYFTGSESAHAHHLSPLFIRTLAGTYVRFLETLVTYGPNSEEMDTYTEQMAIFVESGVRQVYRAQPQMPLSRS